MARGTSGRLSVSANLGYPPKSDRFVGEQLFVREAARVAHTVESFVETLRVDGVEAGRKAAAEIREQAERAARELIQEAQAEARRVLEEAERQRRETSERTRTELELAARDTLARLSDALNQALRQVLSHSVGKAFDDVEFLKELIRGVTQSYAQADAAESQLIELNVSESMRRKLVDWAIATLHQRSDGPQLAVELHGNLQSAGFEYKVRDGTVEVTPESVVQLLSQMVTPQLRALLAGGEERSGDGQG